MRYVIAIDSARLGERRNRFAVRRDRVVACLSAMPGITCAIPSGGFYAFPSISGLLTKHGGRFFDDAALCAWLLAEAGLVLVPDRAVGLPGHLRVSFAYSDADLDNALARMDGPVQGTCRERHLWPLPRPV